MPEKENDIPIHYDPASTEAAVYDLWMNRKAFAATPSPGKKPYVIMMPLPNVTGALHMGHAMDNVMQDMLVRRQRMAGADALWMAGTDHAGIATQAIVEKRLFELEGKTRRDIGREALVAKIWDWKEAYQARILSQLKKMGCSCDWDRLRFTMDPVCTRAVRRTFFSMFGDGIIYQGQRLVNWDCKLKTAVSDDEIVYETVPGHYWYLRYPVIDPKPGEPEAVIVATSRPETMLGDTAVACHPDPAAAIDAERAKLADRLETAPKRDRADIEAAIADLEHRKASKLDELVTLAEMARDGRKIHLPLMNREIPLITDEWAKPHKGSGCVKITPAHDPNDFDVWTRHRDHMDIVNILNDDGSLNANTGVYADVDRLAARERVVADLDAGGFLDAVEEKEIEIGHSDRSKTPVEPYLSLQWFVRMGDLPEGITLGKDTDHPITAPGLAQAAIDAASDGWTSPTGRQVRFYPDQDRYRSTYVNWLAEKRDWCISRQLWWGHRIPVWKAEVDADMLAAVYAQLKPSIDAGTVCLRVAYENEGESVKITGALPDMTIHDRVRALVCSRDEAADAAIAEALDRYGFAQDPDVLDTWYSSALWPHSTLGWPDPETAQIEPGQSPLGSVDGGPDCLTTYYPGVCLVTGRDIITLWVARMVVMGLYNLGDVPFTDVFLHANILDGKGERMSKSKGNGIDPVSIIGRYGADALRFVLCDLQTGNQDIRLPVQAISPYTDKPVNLADAQRGKTIFTYVCPDTGKEFDVIGTMPDVPTAELISDRFDAGTSFCTKLWNAARLVCMNLEGYAFAPMALDAAAAPEDRWILSRLEQTIAAVNTHVDAYNPSGAVNAARAFFWSDFCDWYLEIIKPRLAAPQMAGPAQQVAATVLDQVLRLFHPFTPYITETLWQRLNEVAPERGIEAPMATGALLIRAPWPTGNAEWRDAGLEGDFDCLKEVTQRIRDIRAKHGVSPRKPLDVVVRATADRPSVTALLTERLPLTAVLASLDISGSGATDAAAARAFACDLEIAVLGVMDVESERKRLEKRNAELVKQLIQSRKKLSNEGFLKKAKPEIVQKEKDRVARLEAELKGIEESLAALP